MNIEQGFNNSNNVSEDEPTQPEESQPSIEEQSHHLKELLYELYNNPRELTRQDRDILDSSSEAWNLLSLQEKELHKIVTLYPHKK